ncbi:MAG: acetyl-CoA acetyltransferase [Myxococcales bacterium]|nr:acetyl-CoA acetyltransferase [Myxococcales bacterium]
MSGQRAAVIGIGQTQLARRLHMSIAEMTRQAARRALDDAGMDWSDIDAVVLGKTPDIFDGHLFPEHFLADALGAVGKPLLRIHTAGSVGGHTAIQAAHLVQAGLFEKVLTVAYAKESEGDINWAVSGGGLPFYSPLVAGPGGYFAPHIRAYMRRSGAPDHIGVKIAYKDRRNAALNPYAHNPDPTITYERIAQSPMLWEPIRYLEACPSSDGACAMVIVSDAHADRGALPPAWILGTACRSEPSTAPRRDTINPVGGREASRAACAQAGITDPQREIDCAEMYVPFSWYEAMWMENMGLADEGYGWRRVEAGDHEIGGAMPINMSGGLMSGNATGATGMIRFAEAAMQVRGQAGEHQVDGAKRALGHAFGGASSYFAVWVVGSERP